MLISSFLTSIGGQGSEQRHFHLRVRQRGRVLLSKALYKIIMKATKSKSKTASNMESELASSLQKAKTEKPT